MDNQQPVQSKPYPLNNNYIVYSDGRIFSKKVNRFLTQCTNSDGYVMCGPSSVHGIVAKTFLGFPPYARPCVNHKDSNRLNNSLDNLEWVTAKENVKYSIEFGNRGKTCSKKDRQEIVKLYNNGLTTNIIAQKYGVGAPQIRQILNQESIKLQHPNRLTKEKSTQIFELASQGFSRKEIAKRLSLTYSCVNNRLWRGSSTSRKA